MVYSLNEFTKNSFSTIDIAVILCIINIYSIDGRFSEIEGGILYLKVIISNSDSRPIYEQITAQIKNLIISGSLKSGDALPSMRFLAKELRISVITTKRAYEELERSGFIETVAGKGSFVSGMNADFIRAKQKSICSRRWTLRSQREYPRKSLRKR